MKKRPAQTRPTILSMFLSLSLFISLTPQVRSNASQPVSGSGAARVVVPTSEAARTLNTRDDYSKLPLSFEQNMGQSHQDVKFLSRGKGYTLYLTSREAVLILLKVNRICSTTKKTRSAVLRMKLLMATLIRALKVRKNCLARYITATRKLAPTPLRRAFKARGVARHRRRLVCQPATVGIRLHHSSGADPIDQISLKALTNCELKTRPPGRRRKYEAEHSPAYLSRDRMDASRLLAASCEAPRGRICVNVYTRKR